jgi:hypothetical protein
MDDVQYEPMIWDGNVNNKERVKQINTFIYYANFGLLFTMFWMMVAMTSYVSTTLVDSRKLLKDGTDTLVDFGELLPKVNESLYILETLCNSKHSPIHEWCKA